MESSLTLYIFVCVCVCVRARVRGVCVCVYGFCVCVCVCVWCLYVCVCGMCVCGVCVCSFLFYFMDERTDGCPYASLPNACMSVYQMAALEEHFVHRCVVLKFEVQCSPLHNILVVTALGMLSDLL